MRKIVVKCLNELLSGEILLFLFLVSPMYKLLLPTQKFFDIALPLLVLNLFILFFNIYKRRQTVLRDSLPLTIWLVPLFILFLFFVFSYIHTPAPIYGKQKLFDIIFRMPFFSIACFFILSSKKSIKKFLVLWIVFSALISFTSLFNYFFITDRDYSRCVTIGGNYLEASIQICVSCFILAILFISSRCLNKNYSLMFFVLFNLFVYTILILASRSPIMIFLILLLILCVIFLFRSSFFQINMKRCITLLISVSVVCIITYSTGGLNMFGLRMAHISNDNEPLDASLYQQVEIAAIMSQNETTSKQIDLPHDVKHSLIYLNASEAQKKLMDQLEQTELQYFANKKDPKANILSYKQKKLLIALGTPILNRQTNELLHLPISYDEQLYNCIIRSEALPRMYMFSTALNIMKQKPLTGWGLGSYPYLMLNRDTICYPHISFFELIIECGIFSLIPYFLFFIYPLYRLCYAVYRTKNSKALLLAILIGTIFLLIRSTLTAATGEVLSVTFLALSCRTITLAETEEEPVIRFIKKLIKLNDQESKKT